MSNNATSNSSNISIDAAVAEVLIGRETKISDILGVDIDPVDEGYLALKKFAEEHADEVVFSEEGPSISFSTEDVSFKIRADTDESFNTVYQATATTFLPTTIIFESDYVGSIAEALYALAEFTKEEFAEVETEGDEEEGESDSESGEDEDEDYPEDDQNEDEGDADAKDEDGDEEDRPTRKPMHLKTVK